MTYVLVYGTLKRGFWNHGLLARAKFVGEGITVSDGFHMYDGPFPYVTTNGINRVKGEVFEVPDNQTLANLDRLEGVPSHYNRKEVDVLLTSEEPTIPGLENIVGCYMYVASPSVADRLDNSKRLSPDDDNVCSWQLTKRNQL